MILTIGVIAFGMKNYLHFKYFKITKNYPGELTYWNFNNSFATYFVDQISTFFPFFIKTQNTDLNKVDLNKLKTLEKYIKICLILFYVGILMIPLCLKLQDYLK